MPYKIEEGDNYFAYSIEGLFSNQDIHDLLKHFDEKTAEGEKHKFLMDFSGMTEREESTTKIAFARMEKGLPIGVKIALVYLEKGSFKQLLVLITQVMRKSAKLFEDRQEAEKWLLEQS